MYTKNLKNERGAALFISLIMMSICAVLGMGSLTTSQIEERISGNERVSKVAFYSAEAGIENARDYLADHYSTTDNWTSLLNTQIFSNETLANSSATYTVLISNNSAEINPLIDSDRIVIAHSTSNGPDNSSASIEATLEGVVGSFGISSYVSQEGGGQYKQSHEINDDNPVDFTAQQVFQLQ